MNQDCIIGPHARQEHAQFNEVSWIFDFFEAQGHQGTMIDAGAHLGSTFQPFAMAAWTVHAIEPFPSHFETLQQRWSHCYNVSLHKVAVSDTSSAKLPFYASYESNGINSLMPFRDSHKKIGEVETTTLSSLLEESSIQEVDFLKIDTEGYDFMALKGYPWQSVKPRIIICEFEDIKTQSIGYDMREMANFLQQQGYSILVSEWHPITRYGISHDWKALKNFPCVLDDEAAWGNLLAIRDKGDATALLESARAQVSFRRAQLPGDRNVNAKPRINSSFVNSVFAGKKVVIFGAGAGGQMALDCLREGSCEILGLADNDTLKQDAGFAGFHVFAPGKLASLEFDLVLIASSFAPSIYQQLNELGIADKKIALFDIPADQHLADEWQKKHQSRLEPYKDKMLGNDCFILSTGASLRKIDLSPFSRYYTIGLNKIHLLEAGFLPDFQLTLSPIAIRESKEKLKQLSHTVFLPFNLMKECGLENKEPFVPIHVTHNHGFSKNALKSIHQGYTALHASLQLAWFLGFSNVYILGADHRIDPTNSKQNPNSRPHPSNFYNQEWLAPDPSGAAYNLSQARTAFGNADPQRQIFDATQNGDLNVFEKRSLSEALTKCRTKR